MTEIFTEPFEVDRQTMMSGWEPVPGVPRNEKHLDLFN